MMAVLPTPGAPSTATRRLPPMALARCRAPRWEASWAGALPCAPSAPARAPQPRRTPERPGPARPGRRAELAAGGETGEQADGGCANSSGGAEARRSTDSARGAHTPPPPRSATGGAGAPGPDLLAARVPQPSGAREAAPPLGASDPPSRSRSGSRGRRPRQRRGRPRGSDEVTGRRPSSLPRPARDAPPRKGRGKVTGAQGARGGTQPPPRAALLSPAPK